MASLYVEVTRELRRNHFVLLKGRGKGAHEMWQNELTGKKVIISPNLKSKPLANKILKNAGLSKKL